MQSNQARAIRTSTRHVRRKYLSVILVVSCFFAGSVFAQETTNSSLSGVKEVLQSFISIMSRGWVVLAALAGKMMSNDRVFGATLHMDIYLRKIWNIMKNFANFGLIAFLLGTLIKNLIKWGGIKAKDIIIKTLVAGVLIQASWFLMGALIDVSTVAVTAIWSFPTSFMQSNTDFSTHMKKEVSLIRQTSINVDGHADPQKIVTIENAGNDTTQNPMTEDDILESLMPSANSLWGPLIFLWSSVFRFYDYLWQTQSQTTETLVVNFSLKTIVLLMYTLALLLLLIANIVRVAFLRIFIIASPFIVLFKVFNDDKMPGDAKGKWIAQYLSFSWLLDLVFKPVMFMAMMSLILILVVSIQNIMLNQSTIDLNGVSMSIEPTAKTATLAVQWVSSVTINDNLFATLGGTSKSVFADLILFFLTIFLMRELVKWSLTSGTGPIQSVMKPVTDFVENFAKTAPIFWWKSYNVLSESSKQTIGKTAKNFGLDENSRKSGKFSQAERDFQNKLEQRLWLGTWWTNENFATLEKDIASGDKNAFWTTTESIASNPQLRWWLYMDVSDKAWRRLLEKWLVRNNNIRWDTWFKWSYLNFEQFFKDEANPNAGKNRFALYKQMGGKANSKNKKDFTETKPPTYEEIMNNVYYAS